MAKKKSLSFEEFQEQNKSKEDKSNTFESKNSIKFKGKPAATNITIVNSESKKLKSEYKYFLPSDTSAIFNANDIDNFSLKFNKYPRFEDKKPVFFKTDKGNIKLNDTFFNFDEKIISKSRKEIIESAQKLFSNENCTIFEKEVQWRMVVGLGCESVYETSMTLHPVYGFPYIPGQAVKGMVRSWIIQEVFGGYEQNAYKDSEAFCRIFGCPETYTFIVRDENGNPVKEKGKDKKETVKSYLKKDYQGAVTFFDAVPVGAPKLIVDVMNPHYGPYYSDDSGNTPPADYFNPIPIYFLTVDSGAKFQFIYGIRENKNINIEGDNLGDGSLLNIINRYFEEALTEKGIGAKTSVGYGNFKSIVTK